MTKKKCFSFKFEVSGKIRGKKGVILGQNLGIDNLYLPEEKMLTLGSARGWPSTAFAAGHLSGGTHMLLS